MLTALAGFVHTTTYNKKNMTNVEIYEAVFRFVFDNKLAEVCVIAHPGNTREKQKDVTLIVPLNQEKRYAYCFFDYEDQSGTT